MWSTLKRIGEVLGILTIPRLRERHVVRLSKALDEVLAQLAQAEIELADKAFYVREFAAVSAERDALKAENLRLAGLYGLEYAKTVTVERDALKTQLQRATDHNRTITEGYKAEIAALRERASVPVKVRWNVTPEQVEAEIWGSVDAADAARKAMNYLAAHAVLKADS